MKVSKKVKIVSGSVLGLAFLLFATLVVHIAVMVHQRGPLALSTIQMARADFQVAVDSLQAGQIKNQITAMKGVRSVYFNVNDAIVVYAYDNRKNTAQGIFDKAIESSGLPVVRYKVSAEALTKGCPAMSDGSFYGKLTALVSSFVQ